MAQAQVPPLSGVGESRAVDVLHQLRQSLGEEGQVHFVPDVVLGPLEQVQQGLQERSQLWAAERTKTDQKPQSNVQSTRRPSKSIRLCSRILTTFLEAGEALVLGHSAAGAGRLARRTGQGVEATEGAELRPLFLLRHLCRL